MRHGRQHQASPQEALAAAGRKLGERGEGAGYQSPLRKLPPPPLDVPSPTGGERGGGLSSESSSVGTNDDDNKSHDDNPRDKEDRDDKGGGARRGWNPEMPETPVALNAPTPAYCSRRRIGVGVDGSEGAKAALRWVVRNYYRFVCVCVRAGV